MTKISKQFNNFDLNSLFNSTNYHFLFNRYPMQSRLVRQEMISEWIISTLISNLILQKISNKFCTTIITQQITIIDRSARRLFQLDFYLQLYSKCIQPKYWHSFKSKMRLSYEERNWLSARKASSKYRNWLKLAQLVLLKINRDKGVTYFEKALLESTLMSSLIFFLLNSFRKSAMISRKCMIIMKACRF